METSNSLKKILSSKENFDKLVKIAESFGIVGKYGKGVNKLDDVFEKVFTGNLYPEKVKEEIKKSFGFGDELCNDIAKEMEREIFSNYKKELEELYSSSFQKEENKKEIKEEKAPKTVPETSPEKSEKTPLKKSDDVSQILKELEKELEKEKTNEL